jgi:hypothetical protein
MAISRRADPTSDLPLARTSLQPAHLLLLRDTAHAGVRATSASPPCPTTSNIATCPRRAVRALTGRWSCSALFRRWRICPLRWSDASRRQRAKLAVHTTGALAPRATASRSGNACSSCELSRRCVEVRVVGRLGRRDRCRDEGGASCSGAASCAGPRGVQLSSGRPSRRPTRARLTG